MSEREGTINVARFGERVDCHVPPPTKALLIHLPSEGLLLNKSSNSVWLCWDLTRAKLSLGNPQICHLTLPIVLLIYLFYAWCSFISSLIVSPEQNSSEDYLCLLLSPLAFMNFAVKNQKVKIVKFLENQSQPTPGHSSIANIGLSLEKDVREKCVQFQTTCLLAHRRMLLAISYIILIFLIFPKLVWFVWDMISGPCSPELMLVRHSKSPRRCRSKLCGFL